MLHIFRRHQKIILIVVAVVIIVTFVFWGSQTGGSGRNLQERASVGKLGGKSISYEEFNRQVNAFRLMNYVSTGQNVDMRRYEMQLQQFAWRQLVLGRKVDQMGICVPMERAVDQIHTMRLFQKDGKFDPETYRRFRDAILPNFGFNEDGFIKVVQQDLAKEELQRIIGSTAKVTPLELQQDYQMGRGRIAVAVVTFNSTNYLAQVKPTDAEIKTEFEKNKEAYRIPERVRVHYVKLYVEDFLSKVTVTDAEIKERYESHKAAFTDPKTKEVKPLTAVQEELRKEIARPRAIQLVRELAEKINDEILPDPRNPKEKRPDLVTVAQKRGLVMADSDFFSMRDELKFSSAPKFKQVAFGLSPENPYEIASAPDGVYLIQFMDRKPSEEAKLEAVRAKVVEDFTRFKALELARQDGRAKLEKFRAAFGSDKTKPALEKLAADAGLKAITPPIFAAGDPPQDLPESQIVVESCEPLAPGEMSEFVETREGGLIVQVKDRQPADTTKFAEEEKQLRQRLLDGVHFYSMNQPGKRDMAFNAWFQQQYAEAKVEPSQIPGQSKGLAPEDQ